MLPVMKHYRLTYGILLSFANYVHSFSFQNDSKENNYRQN